MIEIHFVSTKCFINTSYAERLQLRASYSIWISVYPGHTGLCSICKYFMFHTLIYRSPCSHGCWLGSCLLGRLRNQDKPGLVLSNRWFANSPTKLPFLCVFFFMLWSNNKTSSVTYHRSQEWKVHGRMLSPEKSTCSPPSTLDPPTSHQPSCHLPHFSPPPQTRS